MEDEQRDAIRAANKRRGNCRKCGNPSLIERDGGEVGGLPGIRYKVCNNCGEVRAITHRARRHKI